MVKGHYLKLRSCSPLFCNFKWFNIKAAAAHHPIILKVVRLLTKGAVEPLSGGAGFYSNVFVVPKHVGGLWPILNLKWLIIICICLLLYAYYVWQLIQCGDYAFLIDLRDAYLHIPIVRHYFCGLFGNICHISGHFYLLVWPQPLGFSLSSPN